MGCYLLVSIYLGSISTSGHILDRISPFPKCKKGNINFSSVFRDSIVFISLITALIFFLPAGIIEIPKAIRDSVRKRKNKRKRREREQSGYIYHYFIGGAGVLICKDCGHLEEIVSFLHGFGDLYSETGYQCPECGRHVSVTKDKNTEPNLICKCGGILKRGDPLFCSQCRSKKLKYNFRMIT